MTGALTLRRVSDGVVGELESTYSVTAEPAPELNWPGLGAAARDAAVDEVRNWLSGAAILASHCKVMGNAAIGEPGVLTSANPFQHHVRAALLAQGAPADLAGAWDEAFLAAWSEWSTQVTIPGLFFFPTLALVAQAEAPPTPNTPHPLGALVSAGIAAMTPTGLVERVTSALATAASGPAATTAIAAFATDIGGRFALLLPTAHVIGVYGSGPVPVFKNTGYDPGPVLNGKCEGKNVITATAMF
jgi:hypothetical protein